MSDFWINIFIRTDANLNRPKPTFSNQQPDIPNSLECCSQFTPWPFSLRWMYITPDLIGFSLLEISPSTFPLWVTLGITLEIIGPTDPLYRLIVTTCQGRGGLNYLMIFLPIRVCAKLACDALLIGILRKWCAWNH